jgi:hypothetical protein
MGTATMGIGATTKKFLGATMKKFEWQATESAPKNYVMSIVSGSLIYHDGSGSLYVPDGSDIQGGWGKGISSHVVGDDLKPLPNKLAITFFSYTENQFYRGNFDLPYEKILALFQAGFYSPNQEKHITYDQIVVGVAPGGAVSVWLWGYEKITEVFFGQAEKVDIEWSHLTSATHISREEYVRQSVEYSLKTPERIDALRKNGVPIGLWNTYRARYNWQPMFTGVSVRDGRIRLIKYFNGEQDYLNYPLEKEVISNTRAIPSYMSFVWERPQGKGRLFELTFNETEIFDAFKKLGSNNQPLQLEMRMELVEGKSMFSVALRNDKESIKLKRTDLQNYAARDRKAEAAQ